MLNAGRSKEEFGQSKRNILLNSCKVLGPTYDQVDKYGSKHTDSGTNVQAKIGGTYGRTRTDGVNIYEKERTEYIYEKERTEYTYEKERTEYIYKKAKIRELYVQMTKHIFGTNLSHNVLKLIHGR